MSTTLAQSSAGSFLSVSASLPASELLASYSALTFTKVAEITDLGAVGKKYNKTDHNPIDNRQTFKFKTTFDNGSLALKMAEATSDAGQAVLLTALDSDADITIKITQQDGKARYMRAKVMSYVSNFGSATSLLSADCELQVTGTIFKDA